MALTQIDDRGLKTPIDLLDSEKIRFGTDNDLEIYHVGSDGNYSYITDSSGRVYLKSNRFYGQAADGVNQIYWEADGATNLYYDGSKKLETRSDGVGITGILNMSSHIYLGDDDYLICGASNDLQIYHDGSHI